MEYSFNVPVLREKLKNIDDKLTLCTPDEYNAYVQDHNSIVGFLKQYPLNSSLSFYAPTSELMKQIENKSIVNATKLLSCEDIQKTLIYFNNLKFTNLDKLKLQRVDITRTMELVNRFLDNYSPDTKEVLDSMIKQDYLCISYEPIKVAPKATGVSCTLIKDDTNLAYIRSFADIHDGDTLAHELGHIMQGKDIDNISSSSNMLTSSLIESVALLNQMLYIDSIEDEDLAKDKLKAKSDLLRTMECYVYEVLKNPYSRYGKFTYSFLASLYLYHLNNTDKELFNESLTKLNSMITTSLDIDIIDSLGINIDKLKEAIDSYMSNYKEEIAKQKRFKIWSN